ncbi:PREDICTED: myosin regulatory light chain 2-like [Elephantulus edwardii]|nr:PREDICTED: myosin regulatory light chain 2-like [Elephantulus edwardii]
MRPSVSAETDSLGSPAERLSGLQAVRWLHQACRTSRGPAGRLFNLECLCGSHVSPSDKAPQLGNSFREEAWVHSVTVLAVMATVVEFVSFTAAKVALWNRPLQGCVSSTQEKAAGRAGPTHCVTSVPEETRSQATTSSLEEEPRLDPQAFQTHVRPRPCPISLPFTLPQSPKKAKKRAEGANSNVFSMFEQTQIQEFKEAFTIMDQNRDGFIDKNDLRDTFAALGRVNVKNEEIDEMIKEAPGPINFTVFLTMFGEKLKGADPEETILNAFKVFDPEGKGVLKADYIQEMLTTQAERFSKEEIDQMFAAFPPDVTGNLDYKNLVHIITHGEEKD